jgi:flagellar M-ring protein FliF
VNQLLKIWRSLNRQQQASLVLVPVLLIAAIWGGMRWKHESNFHVVYSGLAPEDAAALTQKLKEASIEYKLDETGASILVPSSRMADARLAIAGAGLPHSGRIGFELFDRSNLGASDFAEQVNYRRALEGELERTIATLAEVEQARVHLTFAKESVFLDEKRPSKATVVLRLKRAAPMSSANVNAVANLVASAVDGLAPESVAIIDSNGRLLNRPKEPGDAGEQLAEANLEYKRQVEVELINKVNTALEPLLGAGKFRAGVNVDCDFSSSEENEESFDSTKSVVVTSQASEESSATGLSAGTPGTASNLPKPTAQPERQAIGATGVTRRSENVTWQPGRTVRRTVQPRGLIRRISAAVLVDQTVRWEGSGPKIRKVFVPPAPEILKGVRDVVAGVTGYNEQRGDVITVETLPFENTMSAEPPPSANPQPASKGIPLTVKQPAVIAAIVLGLAALGFLGWMLRRKKRKTAELKGQGELPAGAPQTKLAAAGNPDIDYERQLAENEEENALLEKEAMSRIKLPAHTRKTEVLMKHIRTTSQKDPVNTANVLRTWIADSDDRVSS